MLNLSRLNLILVCNVIAGFKFLSSNSTTAIRDEDLHSDPRKCLLLEGFNTLKYALHLPFHRLSSLDPSQIRITCSSNRMPEKR